MLFKDSEKFKTFGDITKGTDFAAFKNTLQVVEENYLVPILGNTLYSALNSAYTLATDESLLSTANKNLLYQCRRVVGPALCYEWAPKTDVSLNEGGMRRAETAEKKTAYQEQRTAFREANLRETESAIEALLLFLDTNKSSYDQWTASEEYKEYQSLFIKTGKEFGKMYSSQQTPYRNYMAMRSKMFDVEEQGIRQFLGDELYEDIKSKDKAGTLNDKEEQLVLYIKKAVANFTVSQSAPLLNVRIDAHGLTIVGSGASTTDNELTKRANADNNSISHLIRNTESAGQSWLTQATKHLDKYATDFPLWVTDKDRDDELPQSGNNEGDAVFGLV